MNYAPLINEHSSSEVRKVSLKSSEEDETDSDEDILKENTMTRKKLKNKKTIKPKKNTKNMKSMF